eukprot:scaffold4672_cov36-Phaeocystis_antarctica.AAC.1
MPAPKPPCLSIRRSTQARRAAGRKKLPCIRVRGRGRVGIRVMVRLRALVRVEAVAVVGLHRVVRRDVACPGVAHHGRDVRRRAQHVIEEEACGVRVLRQGLVPWLGLGLGVRVRVSGQGQGQGQG